MPEHIPELVWERRVLRNVVDGDFLNRTDLIAPLGGEEFYRIAPRITGGFRLWLCAPSHLPQFLGRYADEDEAKAAAITHSGNDSP
jgi:hypothetical protein